MLRGECVRVYSWKQSMELSWLVRHARDERCGGSPLYGTASDTIKIIIQVLSARRSSIRRTFCISVRRQVACERNIQRALGRFLG